MRWCLPIAVLFGLSAVDAVSFAQGQGGAERLARHGPTSGWDEHLDAGYFAATGVVRFQLIQGRLRLDLPRHRKGSQAQDQRGVYESITVTARRGIPSLQYVCQAKHQHLSLSVQDATYVRIESWFPKTGQRVTLDQPARGAIRWQSENGDLKSEYSGATLLHVRHQDPQEFDLHFGRLFRQVLRGRSMRSVCGQTQAAVTGMLPQSDMSCVAIEDVHRCVEQMGSGKRSVRGKAERQLLRWGTPVIPILNALDQADLDAEQVSRLDVVYRRLQRCEDDTAASLAAMLVNDESYWQCVVSKLSGQEIAQANVYLNQVGLDALQPHRRGEQIAAANLETPTR